MGVSSTPGPNASANANAKTKSTATGAGAGDAGAGDNDGRFTDPNSRFFILYGGEASTQVARDLAEKAAARGFNPRLVAMDDFKQCALDATPAAALFVVETIENAQPAEAAGTCLRFYNRKRKAGEKGLFAGKLRYAVLGLGDTNLLLDRQSTTAKDCNQSAQTLDSALKFLGAEQICTRGEANDAVGLEEAFEPWCDALWAPLADAVKAACGGSDGGGGTNSNGAGSSSGTEVHFLYGSQTGNATEICKAMAAEAAAVGRGFTARCNAMNEVAVTDVLTPGAVLVFVVSSTGDGDAPDNCDAFFTRLKRVAKKEAGTIGLGVQYSVLGLGDQNYSAFMGIPRSFTMAMEKAGATAFYPRGEADDTLGLYEYCETWQDGLWAPLKSATEFAPALKANPELGAKPPKVSAAAAAAAAEKSAEASSTMTTANDDAAAVVASPKAPAAAGAAPAVPVAVSVMANVAESDLTGVPALPACRVAVTWSPESAAAVYPLGGCGASPPSGAAAFTPEEPYLAPVAACELMTDPASDRRVLHVEFDLTDAAPGAATFEPGDSLGVWPVNDPALVHAVAARLGLDLDAFFTLRWAEGQGAAPPLPHVRCPATVRAALSHTLDLTGQPRKSLLRVLAEACSEPAERADLLLLCSRGGKEAYAARIAGEAPTLLDLLDQHPSCTPGWAELLDALQPLQPRLYSITTAPEAHPGRPAVAFSVVKYAVTSGVERAGVATNWIDREIAAAAAKGRIGAKNGFKVPVYIKRAGPFKPPEDPAAPVIMIGPGTGVAPFRGFLERRRAQLQLMDVGATAGPAWLFFGCRGADEDFLYRQDLEGFAADGTISELITAFSRTGPEKVYVQHKLVERAKEVAAMVTAVGAHVFVCGDGVGMARDVHAALVEALATHVTGMDATGAAAALAAMTKEGRYVRDIWS